MKKLLVVMSMMLLAACSGGGGSSTTNVPTAQKTVIGTASEGAPLTGTAYLKDSKGAETTSPIDAAGGFKFVVDNMTAPYILKAGTLYSFASAPGTFNINPFTDLSVKNASNVTDMAPVYNGTASALAPQLQAIQSKIQTAVDDLNTKIDQVYQKYGLTSAAQKNFMTGGITIGQGVDAMFDTFKVAIAANGTITMKTKTGDAPIFTASRNSTTGIMTITFDPNLTANMPSTLVGAPVFTTSMLSSKSFSVDGGTITFNVDGTMSGVGINVAGGAWNINSSGQLIMTGSSKGTRTCTIVSGNAANGWNLNVTYSGSTPPETIILVPTTTPTANIFTAAMLSGKSFTVVGSGTITFNADGTVSGVGINTTGGTWSVNSSGQLIMTGSSKGTRTCTIVSGNIANGWTLNVTYASSTPSEIMIFVPTTTPTPTGVTYSQADLSGTWYYFQYIAGSNPYWARATFTIDANGNAVPSNGINSHGNTGQTSINKLTVTSDGVVTSLSNPTSTTKIFMASNKQLMVGSGGTTGEESLYILVKAASGFNQNDLTGTWKLNYLLASSSSKNWKRADVTINNSGLMTFANHVSSEGTNTNPTSVTLSVSSNGITTIPGSSMNYYSAITADKNTMVATWSNGDGTESIGLFVRTGGTTFSQADLQGIWRNNMLSIGGSNYWLRDLSIIDANGNKTSFEVVANGISEPNSSSTPITINSVGVFSSAISSSFEGILTKNKNIGISTSTSNSSEFKLGIIIK